MTGNNGHVMVWDVASGTRLKTITVSGDVDAIAYSPAGDFVAVAIGLDIDIWSTTTWQKERTLRVKGAVE
ncbi:MAG TPA: hypothetical protein DD670_00015, partial [Planctomycetaceae bacterium]|nr:hypothetical protein [Planctomycetaceae bacterium]